MNFGYCGVFGTHLSSLSGISCCGIFFHYAKTYSYNGGTSLEIWGGTKPPLTIVTLRSPVFFYIHFTRRNVREALRKPNVGKISNCWNIILIFQSVEAWHRWRLTSCLSFLTFGFPPRKNYAGLFVPHSSPRQSPRSARRRRFPRNRHLSERQSCVETSWRSREGSALRNGQVSERPWRRFSQQADVFGFLVWGKSFLRLRRELKKFEKWSIMYFRKLQLISGFPSEMSTSSKQKFWFCTCVAFVMSSYSHSAISQTVKFGHGWYLEIKIINIDA